MAGSALGAAPANAPLGAAYLADDNFANYKPLISWHQNLVPAGTAAGVYVMNRGNTIAIASFNTADGSAIVANHGFLIDPANFPDPSGRSLRVRGRYFVAANGTSIGSNGFGIWLGIAITANGASGAPRYISNGSQIPDGYSGTPTVSALTTATDADIAISSAGFYAIFVNMNTATAALSHLSISALIEYRHV